jgi:hypothetical protein
MPFLWWASNKAWVTAPLFLEWFHESFINEVEIFMVSKNLEFKDQLFIRNAPGHPNDVS